MEQSQSTSDEVGARRVIKEVEEFVMNEALPKKGKDGGAVSEHERRAKAALARFGSGEEDANMGATGYLTT